MSTPKPTGTFPYAQDVLGERTSGIAFSSPEHGSITIPGPGDALATPPKLRGVVRPYLGSTVSCIDTNTVAHGVLAGDA